MKILILGAGGMIGHRVWIELKEAFGMNAFGLIRKSLNHYREENQKKFDNNIIEKFDVSDWSETEELLNVLRPGWVINAIGITIRKPEILNFDYALEINSFFPQRLLKWAQRNNSKVIHFSTDCIFSGDKGQYLEESNPSAKDVYGRTKFLGEIDGENGLTLRFSCIGRELESHTELLDWFLFQPDKKIKGYDRAIYSGITSHVVAQEVVNIIKKYPKLNGVFQLSSAPISKYDLLNLIKEKYEINCDIERVTNYTSDKSLNCSKYNKATGFIAPSWENMIEEMKNDQRVSYKEYK